MVKPAWILAALLALLPAMNPANDDGSRNPNPSGKDTGESPGGGGPAAPGSNGGAPEKNDRNVFLVPVSPRSGWQELAYLAAIPASKKLSKEMPSVVALDGFGLLLDEVKDYLKRYDPAMTYLIGQEAEWSEGHWKLDEGAGATAKDSSGHGRDGAIHGAAWSGGKLVFDGIDDHVEITGYQGLAGSAERTVAAWIRTTEVNGEILSWGQHGLPGGSWVMRVQEKGRLSLDIGGAFVVGSAYLCDGEWHHVAAVLPGGCDPVINNIRLYVDGAPDKISEMWDAASGALKNNLVGYWRLEEGQGKTIHDSATGGCDGTCYTDLGAGGNYPDWGPGILGTGLYFDNMDYIEIENEGHFDATADAFTVSCWVKHNWEWYVGGNDLLVTKGNQFQGGWELGRAEDSNWCKVCAKGVKAESNAVSPVEVWHHVVGLYNGERLKLYVNGLERAQNSVSDIGTNNVPVRIGCGDWCGGPSSSGPGKGRCMGWIDEVAVWDRPLDRTEIEDLYNSGQGMVIDLTSTAVDTQASSDVKIGVFDGSFQYFQGKIEDVRIYGGGLSEAQVLSLKKRRNQKYAGITGLPGGSLDGTACHLAGTFWTGSDRVVLVEAADYARALPAAVLAARLEVPLLFFDAASGLSPEALACIGGLQPHTALLAGGNPAVQGQLAGLGVASQVLEDALEVAAWMVQAGMATDYIAAVNPKDRALGRVPKSSLAGALLAAGREGAVACLPFDTDWKHPFWYSDATSVQPPGAPNSKTGFWYLGSFSLSASTYAFVISTNSHTTHYNRLNIDFNGNGGFGDPGEGPFESADVVAVDGADYAVTIGTEEEQTPGNIKFTYPCAAEVRGVLAPYYDALGKHPEYLCMVGLPEVIPFGLVNGYYAYPDVEDIPSDAPFADVDGDPFYEIAVGRVFGETLSFATLLAARSLTYRDLIHDPDTWALRTMWTGEFWDQQFMMPHKLENVGFHPTVIHALDPDYDKTLLSIVIQDDHGVPSGIGKGWNIELEALLAPCVIEAGGCDSAGIDEVPLEKAFSVHMLRKGAVAYIGTQRGTPEDKRQYRQDFWNAVLTGATLGQGHRRGLNSMKVGDLDEFQPPVYVNYCLHSEAFYGDPAVKIYIPSAPALAPACVAADGATLSVMAPEAHWFDHIPSGTYTGHYHTGPGLHPDYKQAVQFFLAEWVTDQQVTDMIQDPAVPASLGWPTGKWFVDEHQDGTRSICWRVRFLQFDQATGNILKQADRIDYTVRF